MCVIAGVVKCGILCLFIINTRALMIWDVIWLVVLFRVLYVFYLSCCMPGLLVVSIHRWWGRGLFPFCSSCIRCVCWEDRFVYRMCYCKFPLVAFRVNVSVCDWTWGGWGHYRGLITHVYQYWVYFFTTLHTVTGAVCTDRTVGQFTLTRKAVTNPVFQISSFLFSNL